MALSPYTPIPLIDKQDSFELVRDYIAQMMVDEVANQKALAVVAGKDPALWDLRVSIERNNPWESFLNENAAKVRTPIVNIFYQNGVFDESKSDVVSRQLHEATYNIDCYGYGISADDGNGGHTPGDKTAALEAQRGIKLIRNIIMAPQNTYLQIPRPFIWQRWSSSITMFQPELDGLQSFNVVAARFSLRVRFNETTADPPMEILELIHVEIQRDSDGFVLSELEYDLT